MGRYRQYEEAPEAWDALCHSPRYPFKPGDVIRELDKIAIEEIYEPQAEAYWPEAEQINARCDVVRLFQ